MSEFLYWESAVQFEFVLGEIKNMQGKYLFWKNLVLKISRYWRRMNLIGFINSCFVVIDIMIQKLADRNEALLRIVPSMFKMDRTSVCTMYFKSVKPRTRYQMTNFMPVCYRRCFSTVWSVIADCISKCEMFWFWPNSKRSQNMDFLRQLSVFRSFPVRSRVLHNFSRPWESPWPPKLLVYSEWNSWAEKLQLQFQIC